MNAYISCNICTIRFFSAQHTEYEVKVGRKLQFTVVELGVILLVKLNGAFNAKSHPMCAHIFVLCVSRLVKLTPGTRTSLRCTYKRADTNGLVNE